MLMHVTMKQSSRRAHLHVLWSSMVAASLGACSKKAAKPTQAKPKAAAPTTDQVFRIAWTNQAGWLPFKLAQSEGFLKKRAEEHGVKIELVAFGTDADAQQAYISGKVAGAFLSSPDLVQCADKEVKSAVILATAKPKAAHAVVVRQGDLSEIRGERVLLETQGVSHYLLVRAQQEAGMKRSDVRPTKIPRGKIAEFFKGEEKAKGAVVKNVQLNELLRSGKARIAFSDENISGEIVDFLALNAELAASQPALAKALCAAWFDATAMLNNPATSTKAQEVLAQAAQVTNAQLKQVFEREAYFTSPDQTRVFLDSPKLLSKMERVVRGSKQGELIQNAALRLGTGSQGPFTLRFDSAYLPTIAALPHQKLLAK